MGQQKSNHLAHYAEITTIHGIKDLVFSRSRVLRLAWSLCLMATLGLLCWYTYEILMYYLSGPTTMIPSNVPLETYPPIHVCSRDWLDDTQVRLYNFTEDEVTAIRKTFHQSPFNNLKDDSYDQLTMKSIKDKMKQYNWSSIQDMTRLSWNVSLESQGVTATIQMKFLSTDNIFHLCQSISNVNRSKHLAIKFPLLVQSVGVTYIVVGEDLFGERAFLAVTYPPCELPYCFYNVEIHEIKKRILLNRPGFECTAHYDSVQACLLDCGHKREVCNCNGTTSTTSYNNSESFWLLDIFKQCNESEFSSSCSQSYDYCTTQCKPCATWKYHFTLADECEESFAFYNSDYDNNLSVSLRFTKVPIMEVSEQAYSYTSSSMLSYIGGLLGLFCGASVLSLVQVFLFWWGDGCHIGKSKVEETVVEDIAEQDNIQSWVQQAALHIPHCKSCSTATAKNIQLQKSEEARTGQQKTNHLANYANNTTIHGIQDFLFMKNKLLKLVWGLFLLAVASLMCEEIYRTVMNYSHAPTTRSISIVDLDTYPTIHVCSDNWYNDAQARSYGFTQGQLAFIRLAFQDPEIYWGDMSMKMKSIDGDNTEFEAQKKSVQRKMEQHNLKTVRDMLNLITGNLSIQGQEFMTSKRWRGQVIGVYSHSYVCHSVSNASFNASAQHGLSITLPGELGVDEFIVVGEDPFAERIKYGYQDASLWHSRGIALKIWDINKRSLLGKDGTCNKGYNSSGVCLQDCASKKDLCNCNGIMKIASYENNEDFLLLASRHDCRDDASCNQTYDSCVEMCTPCTTWDYLVTTKPNYLGYGEVPLTITMVPLMKVSQEYYTYPVASLLSNIGGLMGIFCGASVLSLVQLLLFWWDDGGLLCKTKGTKSNNTDHYIKAWLQQAARRIPQCELCKELTSTRTQNKQGGAVKTSQQKSNHLANYAENTTIHGIKDLVFCKKKMIKVAWGLMLLIVFCLMCEEIYRTVRDYASSPTDIDESTILLDKYPPVHACVIFYPVYDDTQAKSYGFEDDEIKFMQSVFQGYPVNGSDPRRARIKGKMEQHNLKTVRDMLNILTPDVSIADEAMLPDDPIPQKRLRREDNGYFFDSYVCYTFSNYTVRDKGLIIKSARSFQTFFVIGEDPFGLRYEFNMGLEVLMGESNQVSLINKGGTCSHDYNSSGVCVQDCVSKEGVCISNNNSTERLPSYENTETFWLFCDPPGYVNTTCQHIYEECTAKCKLIPPPCTTWTYEISAFQSFDMSRFDTFFKLDIINPSMIVSKEYYTYPASSLLANIGGLVSLFCGGSLLSIVQVILFWGGDGCCGRKGKERKEETAVIPEDDIHKWIQHAALNRT